MGLMLLLNNLYEPPIIIFKFTEKQIDRKKINGR